MGLSPQLQKIIVNELDSMTSYTTKLIVRHGGKLFDVSSAVGPTPSLPSNIPNQPDTYPNKTSYCFDPVFTGKESFNNLVESLNTTIPDCNIIIKKRAVARKKDNFLRYELRCHWYNVTELKSSNFADGCLTSQGIPRTHISTLTSDHVGRKTMFNHAWKKLL